MEYLNRVLGIRTYYQHDTIESLPNYIYARYELKVVTLDGKKAIFVFPREELESVDVVKKHLERISKSGQSPAVLILDNLNYRQKEYMLRDHIPFIVDGKQIYLPFMAVYLQERADCERLEVIDILPSAQVLFLYYIYHGCGELMTCVACEELGFTATSISRASRQLEELGLVQSEKRGVQKVIYTDKQPKELFCLAKNTLMNPVKRTIYVPKAVIKEEMLFSSYSALSEFTELNPPLVEGYAVESVVTLEKNASIRLQNSKEQCAVELWRYDPKKLSSDGCVDRLSLALALRDDKDERVEDAVEEMLNQVWRDIDGKRNREF